MRQGWDRSDHSTENNDIVSELDFLFDEIDDHFALQNNLMTEVEVSAKAPAGRKVGSIRGYHDRVSKIDDIGYGRDIVIARSSSAGEQKSKSGCRNFS